MRTKRNRFWSFLGIVATLLLLSAIGLQQNEMVYASGACHETPQQDGWDFGTQEWDYEVSLDCWNEGVRYKVRYDNPIVRASNGYEGPANSCYSITVTQGQSYPGNAQGLVKFHTINQGACAPLIGFRVTTTWSPWIPGTKHNIVVLVPGYQGFGQEQMYASEGITRYTSADASDPNFGEMWSLADSLIRYAGVDVYIAHLETGPDHTWSLEKNAKELKAQIESIKDNDIDGKVDVVAYSMGGDVVRAYIENTNLYPQKIEDGTVSRVFTLGTPHKGVPLALLNFFNNLLHFRDLDCLKEPDGAVKQAGGCQLVDTNMNSTSGFNKHYATRAPGVQYYLLSGDLNWYSEAKGDAVKLALFSPFEDDDGMVPLSSGTGLEGDGVKQLARTFGEAHLIAWGKQSYFTPFPGGQYPHYPYASVSAKCVVDVINGANTCSNGGIGTASTTQPSVNAILPLESGSALASQAVQKTVVIDQSGDALFFANWQMGSASFTLIKPGGQVVDPSYAASHSSEVKYEADTDGKGATYQIFSAQTGSWQMNFTTTADTAYNLFAGITSNITLSASTNKPWYAQGENAVVSANLTGSVSGVTVNAALTLPDGSVQAVSLNSTGGGNYQGSLSAPSESGTVLVKVEANGNGPSGAFSREQMLSFDIAAQTASLNGSYDDAGEDIDNNGKFEALVVNASVNVNTVGTYLLSADLTDNTGAFIDHVVTTIDLSVGAHSIALRFSGGAIKNHAVNGPYKLKNILLVDATSSTVPVQQVAIAYSTNSYNYNQFEDINTSAIYLPLIVK